jgi:hypothetical protein
MIEVTRLAENDRIVVVLSEMAVREHLTQHEDELASQLDSAGKSLKSAVRAMRMPDPPVGELERLAGEIAMLPKPLHQAYVASFRAWAKRCKARWITFGGHRIDEVIDDYFSGTGAFSSRKSRKDFPDALILSSAHEIVAEFEQFHLVAGDEHLRNAAERRGISGHETLLHFLESPSVREVRERLAVEQRVRERSEQILSVDNLDRIAAWLRAGAEDLESIHLEHEDIDGLERVGVTVFGATIDYPVPSLIKSLTISLAAHIEGDRWALAVGFETQCELTFATSWPDSIRLEDQRDVTVESADEAVELSESWLVRFDAEIIFDTTQWNLGPDGQAPEIDRLKPQLLVNRAELLRPLSS